MAKTHKHTGFHEKNLLSTVTFGEELILWDCMSTCGVLTLVKLNGFMNHSHQLALDKNVSESVTKLTLHWGWIFQYDNDLKHG